MLQPMACVAIKVQAGYISKQIDLLRLKGLNTTPQLLFSWSLLPPMIMLGSKQQLSRDRNNGPPSADL